MIAIGNDCHMPQRAPSSAPDTSRDDLVEALLSASRALVALAARSLADLDGDVTLAQYRALVVLASRGPQRVVDISSELGVTPSTGTRMCDRLVRKKLIRRYRATTDRREVRLTLTSTGRDLVEEVIRRRRDALLTMVADLPHDLHQPVTIALRSLTVSAGEPVDNDWWLGWASPEDTPPAD
jgi:DNA-binding MarR family transcriptional regulator